MSLESLNDVFQHGETNDPRCSFSSDQLVEAIQDFSYGSSPDKTFGPLPENNYFLRIDHPHEINADGGRTAPAREAAIDLTHIVLDHHEMDPSGIAPGLQFVYGGNGAYVECREVDIPAGKSLLTHYRFLRYGSDPLNAFALLEAFPGDDIDAEPVRMLLRAGWQLENNPFPLRFTGSKQGCWSPDGGFQGTLRWLVGTGENSGPPDSPLAPPNSGSEVRFYRPGCLLLDKVEIV